VPSSRSRPARYPGRAVARRIALVTCSPPKATFCTIARETLPTLFFDQCPRRTDHDFLRKAKRACPGQRLEARPIQVLYRPPAVPPYRGTGSSSERNPAPSVPFRLWKHHGRPMTQFTHLVHRDQLQPRLNRRPRQGTPGHPMERRAHRSSNSPGIPLAGPSVGLVVADQGGLPDSPARWARRCRSANGSPPRSSGTTSASVSGNVRCWPAGS